jgi:hypothetical protein
VHVSISPFDSSFCSIEIAFISAIFSVSLPSLDALFNVNEIEPVVLQRAQPPLSPFLGCTSEALLQLQHPLFGPTNPPGQRAILLGKKTFG